MTADPGGSLDDELLASLARLRTYDGSPGRSRQLRRRCHAMLRPEPQPNRSAWTEDGKPFRRLIVPALAGAWCLAYLLEIVRSTTAIYGYFAAR